MPDFFLFLAGVLFLESTMGMQNFGWAITPYQ